MNNGVSWKTFSLFIFAPCSTKYSINSLFPLLHAMNNGVSLDSFSWFIFTPCFIKRSTDSLFPLIHALNISFSSFLICFLLLFFFNLLDVCPTSLFFSEFVFLFFLRLLILLVFDTVFMFFFLLLFPIWNLIFLYSININKNK